jgi:hypothetical protein
MYDALTTYLSSLVESGVELITHFQHMGKYSAGGSWGLLEWMDQVRRAGRSGVYGRGGVDIAYGSFVG